MKNARVLETVAAFVVAAVVFVATYALINPPVGSDDAALLEKEAAVSLERTLRQAIDCEQTVAAAADACETEKSLTALDKSGATLFSPKKARWRDGPYELKLTCMKEDTWHLLQVDYRGIAAGSNWRPLTRKPIICTDCQGDVAIQARNPFLVASFINHYGGDAEGRVREAVLNTPETAARICALDGVHTRVASVDGTSHWSGKTGWREPSGKTLSYWDKATNRWVTGNAGVLGNQWIANIKCSCPLR